MRTLLPSFALLRFRACLLVGIGYVDCGEVLRLSLQPLRRVRAMLSVRCHALNQPKQRNGLCGVIVAITTAMLLTTIQYCIMAGDRTSGEMREVSRDFPAGRLCVMQDAAGDAAQSPRVFCQQAAGSQTKYAHSSNNGRPLKMWTTDAVWTNMLWHSARRCAISRVIARRLSDPPSSSPASVSGALSWPPLVSHPTAAPSAEYYCLCRLQL